MESRRGHDFGSRRDVGNLRQSTRQTEYGRATDDDENGEARRERVVRRRAGRHLPLLLHAASGARHEGGAHGGIARPGSSESCAAWEHRGVKPRSAPTHADEGGDARAVNLGTGHADTKTRRDYQTVTPRVGLLAVSAREANRNRPQIVPEFVPRAKDLVQTPNSENDKSL